MIEEVDKSFQYSSTGTLLAVPMTMIKVPYLERNESKFESKMKVVILQSVSDLVSSNLSRKNSHSPSKMAIISHSNSMNLLQHASKSNKYVPRLRSKTNFAVQMSSIDVRVWGVKATNKLIFVNEKK